MRRHLARGGRPRVGGFGIPPRAALLASLVAVLLVLGVAGALIGTTAGSGTAGAQVQPPPAPNTALGQAVKGGQLISEPDVFPTKTLDYLYSTGIGYTPPVPMRTFTRLGQLSSTTYNPMPTPPPWVKWGSTIWTPDVRQVGKKYVMWFSGEWISSGGTFRCLGAAQATSPYGPFTSNATLPEVCQGNYYGDIDPRTIKVGTQEYLLWKSNDNVGPAPQQPTKIWSQPLAPNGMTPEGSATELLASTNPWEGGIIESPDMVVDNGQYWLFFSADSAGVPQSGIGLASCGGPTGPCSSTYAGPWLGSNTAGAGPDEESLFQQNGATWVLYTPQATYFPGSLPSLAYSRVAYGPHAPYISTFGGVQPGPP